MVRTDPPTIGRPRMDLILWRHAEAEDTFPDPSRRLTPRGRKQALKVAGRIRQGVEERLWNERRGNYDWGIYTFWLGGHRLGEVSRASDWKRWYPDTTAQVFPVISGLLRPADPRAVSLYQNLNQWHPGWVDQAKTDPHPWSVLGYAAAVMGDTRQALAFTRATAGAYMTNGGPFSELSWEQIGRAHV